MVIAVGRVEAAVVSDAADSKVFARWLGRVRLLGQVDLHDAGLDYFAGPAGPADLADSIVLAGPAVSDALVAGLVGAHLSTAAPAVLRCGLVPDRALL